MINHKGYARKMRVFVLKSLFFLLALMLITACAHDNKASNNSCYKNPKVVEPCFDVKQGHLIVHANLRPYIHTRQGRLLGIVDRPTNTDRTTYNWPDDIADNLELNNSIIADFYVCPFTKEKPGHMKRICIAKVSNMEVLDKQPFG